MSLTGRDINLKIQEVNKPELDAQLVAEGIAQQLEKRIAFRRAMPRFSAPAGPNNVPQQYWDYSVLRKEEFKTKYKMTEEEYQTYGGNN